MPLARSAAEAAGLGFALPHWLDLGEDAPGGPVILLADSAGANLQGLFAACRLALEDAGQPAKLVIGDDARDSAGAARLAAAACDAQIDCCIGHFGTTTAMPASRVYGERGVLFLAPGTSGDALCGPDAPSTVRFFGRDREQQACLSEAASSAGAAVAIFGQPNNYGASLAEGLAADLAALDPLFRIGPPGDLPPGANIRTILLCGSREFAADGVERLGPLAQRANFLLSDDSFGADPSTFAGAAGRASVAFLDQHSSALLDQDVHALRRRAFDLLSAAPGAYFETSYLAVRAFLELWRRFGPERAAWRPALLADRWQTPFGLVGLSPSGDLVGHRWSMMEAA